MVIFSYNIFNKILTFEKNLDIAQGNLIFVSTVVTNVSNTTN